MQRHFSAFSADCFSLYAQSEILNIVIRLLLSASFGGKQFFYSRKDFLSSRKPNVDKAEYIFVCILYFL